jgi:DNA processing protein
VEEEAKALWLSIAAAPGIGEVRLLALVKAFRDPVQVLRATSAQLSAAAGLDSTTASSLGTSVCAETGRARLATLRGLGGRLLVYGHEDYPPPLTKTYAPPPLLFVLGEWASEDERAIAVVGSRRATQYGRRVARALARELAQRGLTVVSGMARGIDSESHRGALEGGGRTIAVLGSGLDVPYPPENRGLMAEIAGRGAVMTEFAPGTEPLAANFPQRNRLISGLAHGVVVVEAANRSGAMITAGYALDQGKEVFAVPGTIESRTSVGTNSLIKQGAKLVQGIDDILEELPPAVAVMPEAAPPSLTGTERDIWEALGEEALHVDALSRQLGLEAPKLLASLLGLELRGLVRQQPGKIFSRA